MRTQQPKYLRVSHAVPRNPSEPIQNTREQKKKKDEEVVSWAMFKSPKSSENNVKYWDLTAKKSLEKWMWNERHSGKGSRLQFDSICSAQIKAESKKKSTMLKRRTMKGAKGKNVGLLPNEQRPKVKANQFVNLAAFVACSPVFFYFFIFRLRYLKWKFWKQLEHHSQHSIRSEREWEHYENTQKH